MITHKLALAVLVFTAACNPPGASGSRTSSQTEQAPTQASSSSDGVKNNNKPKPTPTPSATVIRTAEEKGVRAPAKPDILALRSEFLEDAKRFNKVIPKSTLDGIGLFRTSSNLGEGILGVCVIDPNTNKRDLQFLSPDRWPREWPSQRQFKMTVYHELGHCLLEYSHTADSQMAIMAPYSFSNSQVDAADWEFLLADFFAGRGVGKITDTALVGSDGLITIYITDEDGHQNCNHGDYNFLDEQ